MRLLAIVPDPASAYGLGALLGALPPGTTRVVAYGQATAAVLPPGLDVFVYPVRDGTRLPAPFVEALLEHEGADALLAPTGSVTSTPVPTLLVDLDPRVAPPALVSGEDPASWTWVEGITALPERRPALLRAGLFSVDVLADWFEGPGRLRAGAAPALMARMTDLAGLLGRHRESDRRGGSTPPARSRAAVEVGDLEGPSVSFGEPQAEKSNLPAGNFDLTASRVVPIEVRSAGGLAGGGAVALLAEPAAAPAHAPVETPLAPAPGAAPPAPAPEAAPPASAPEAVLSTPAQVPAPVASQAAEAFRGRHTGARALVLVSPLGLERLSPSAWDGAVLLATPGALPHLAGRFDPAPYVCLAGPPREPEALASLAAMRGVVVHDDRLDPAEFAPAAAATVPLLDLQRAGGPALGWSDDLKVGFFPAGGDAALALQWAHWLGVAEVVLAGADAAEAGPGWLPFLRGARELLEARGVSVTVVDPVAR